MSDVLGLLLLADVELLAGGFALGEGVADFVSCVPLDCTIEVVGALGTYPPAMPVAREAPEPVAPSAMRRAEVEKQRGAMEAREARTMVVRSILEGIGGVLVVRGLW